MSITRVSLARLLGAVLLVAAGAMAWHAPLFGAESAVVLAPPALDNPKAPGAPQTAVWRGGAFGACRACTSTFMGYARFSPATPAATSRRLNTKP